MDLLNLYLNEQGQQAKKLQFEIVLLVIFLLWFFTKIFKDNYGFFIILIIFIVYVSNVWLKVRTNKVTDFNKLTMYKLKVIQDKLNESISLQIKQVLSTNQGEPILTKKEISKIYKKNQLESMFIDANMISFIYSIVSLHQFNPHEYFLFVKGVNNILRLRNEIEEFYNQNKGEFPVNTAEMMEIALHLRKNTLNNLHNFIYSVPKTNSMYKYIDDIVNRYQILITRNIDQIHHFYKLQIETKGINSTTKFISYDETKPFDQLDNHQILPNKNDKSNLIGLYL